MQRSHPIRRALRQRGMEYLWPRARFWWHPGQDASVPYANPHAWVCGGAQQIPLTVSTPVKYLYDERSKLIQAVPANALGWGAPQEPARTNICLQSQTLGTTWGVGNATVTENQAVAPDGTTTADKVESATDGTSRNILQSSLTTTNAVWCFSIFVKQGNLPLTEIGLYDVSASGFIHRVTFTYATKTLATTNGSGGSGYQELANGWFRIWVTGTYPASGSDRVYFYHGGTGATVTGDYTYAWGALVEAGSYPSSYIPTGASPVARSADALRCINAGVFGPLANEGSLLWVGRFPMDAAAAGTSYPVYLNNANGTNENVGLVVDSSRLNAGARSNNVLQFFITANTLGAFASGTVAAAVVTWRANNARLFVNGTLEGTDTSVTVPQALDRLEVGGISSGSTRGGFESFLVAAFGRALQDHEARALTSNPEALKWAS